MPVGALVADDFGPFDQLGRVNAQRAALAADVVLGLVEAVGAQVTDSGEILSQPAIIVREYRVLAVVALGNATDLLRDGQIVTVDGTAGTVTTIS